MGHPLRPPHVGAGRRVLCTSLPLTGAGASAAPLSTQAHACGIRTTTERFHLPI
ncbi:MAG: hypothetical protein R2795_08665 [Saprospiraceae bacterium]